MRQPDLLLLPGLMLNAHIWDAVLPLLKQSGTVHFGHIDGASTIPLIAQEVLADAPEKFILFGFSMGGYVAQQIAVSAPDRVQAMVLINTAARALSADEIKQFEGRVQLAKRATFKGLTERSMKAALHPDHQNNKAILAQMQSMALANGQTVMVRQLTAMKDRVPVNLKEIQCPVCVIGADEDRLFTLGETQQLAAALPDASLHIISGSGHMTLLEQPEQWCAIIQQWLTSLKLNASHEIKR